MPGHRPLNKKLIAELKLKFIYKGNKNVEALNVKTAAKVKALKTEIAETKKDNGLSESAKNDKIKKAEAEIVALQKKCKDQTAVWLAEQAEDARKAKELFNKK